MTVTSYKEPTVGNGFFAGYTKDTLQELQRENATNGGEKALSDLET